MRPSRPALFALAACVLLALFATGRAWDMGRPLVLLGGGEAPDWTGTLWAYWWVGEALLHGQNPFDSSANYFPVGQDPLSQYNLLDAFFAWPFVHGLGPSRGYNVFIFLCMVSTGWGAWWLARQAGASAWGAVVAAFGVQASGFVNSELAAGRVTQAVLLPFFAGLVGLDRLARGEGSWRTGVWTGLCVAATSLIYWYYGFFLVLGGAVCWLAQARQWDRQRFAWLGLAAALTLVLCGPAVADLAASYADLPGVEREAQAAPWGEGLSFHEGFAALQGLWPGFFVWAGPMPVQDRGIALALIVLAPFAFRQGGRPWRWLALMALGYVLALGPFLNTPSRDPTGLPLPFLVLMRVVPFFERLWWPERALPLMLGGLGVLAALGIDRLTSGPRRVLAVVVICGWITGETALRHGTFPMPVELPRPYVPPLYDRLDGPGALLTTPVLGELGSTDGRFNLWMQVNHHRPILGGLGDVVAGHAPPAAEAYVRDNTLLAALYGLSHGADDLGTVQPDDVQTLLDDGFTWLVVDQQTFHLGVRREAARAHRELVQQVFGAPRVRTPQAWAWRMRPLEEPVELGAWDSYLPEDAGTLLLPEMRFEEERR